MIYLLIALHILVSLALIVIVLLQHGKGAEMGASFGSGGSQSVFGAGGGNTFMSKLTTSAAVIFMLTSLTLAYLGGHTGTSSIMPSKSAAPKPAAMPGTPAPSAPVSPGSPMGGTGPAQPVAPAQQGTTAPAQKAPAQAVPAPPAAAKPATPAPQPAAPAPQKKP
jgi:preprotein translocase subunit SecG